MSIHLQSSFFVDDGKERKAMKEKRWIPSPWSWFRFLVVPAMFLAAMSKRPAAQWCAVGMLAFWVILQVSQTIIRKRAAVKHSEPLKIESKKEENDIRKETFSQTELFLIRQINHRITEQLKQTYPTIAWTWAKRPSPKELEHGGSWRIQLSNADPYHFGDVSMKSNGAMSITLILEAPLIKPLETSFDPPADAAELEAGDEPKPSDAMIWYTEYGEDLLAGMIDDLNSQGHKKLTIHDDGEVFIRASGKDIAVDKLAWFLPRIAWPEFEPLLKEDGISASEEAAGLTLAW